jgi:hypothetical protein
MITPLAQLQSESQDIQADVEQVLPDEPELIKERLTVLSVYNARTGRMLADAKYHLNARITSEIMQLLSRASKEAGLTPNVINRLVNASCRDEQYLCDQIERLNRTTTHQIDVLRSLLSFEKEMIRNQPNIS